MKTLKISLLAALISSPLAAETIEKSWEIGVFGDYIKSSTNKDNNSDWKRIEAGKSIGIDVQKIINERWNARFELARTRYDIENGNGKDYGTRFGFGVDAIYKVKDSDLYVFTGIKRFDNVASYNAINAGAGYSFQINEHVSLYSEAAIYRDVDNGYTDQGFKLGVKYAFGDVKKSPIVNKATETVKQEVIQNPATNTDTANNKAMNDADNDGIDDNNDNCLNTPINVKVDSTGCTLYSEKKVAINLNVPFENDSSKLTPDMMNDIQRLADFMTEYTDTNVVIEGHSSAVGNAEYNLKLSQKRANSIKSVLINNFAINENRLSAKGFGETQLLSPGNTIADHNANRRVIAKIETTVQAVVEK